MASQNREFVAVFNVDSGKDNNSIYEFSLFEARANLGDSTVQKRQMDIAENVTSPQTSSEMEASETKKKNRTKQYQSLKLKCGSPHGWATLSSQVWTFVL